MRTLSSIFTFPTKYIFPVALLLGIGVAIFHSMHHAVPQAVAMQPMPFHILTLIIWMGGVGYVFWFAYQLKRVRFDGTALYVSNYRQECRIQLADVDHVSERRWMRSRPIRVVLHQPCDFGSDFIFMPTARFSFGWDEHPIVAELHSAILAAKNSPRLR